MDGFESQTHRRLPRPALQDIEQRVGQTSRCGLILQEFGHDELLGKDIGQADPGLIAHAPHQLPRHRRHPVGDHHRRFGQRRFQCRRAACHQRDVRRRQRILRMAEQQRQGQLPLSPQPQRGLEPLPRFARRHGHEKARDGLPLGEPLGSVDEQLGHVVELGATAAGQQRDDPVVPAQAEPLARGLPLRFQGNDVGERMANEGGSDTDALIERGFEGKQAQYVIDGARDMPNPVPAPGPDGRADVLDGRDAGPPQLFRERQVEIRSIDADENLRPDLSQFAQQALADTQDLPQVTQHFGIAADGEFFCRPACLEARCLHFRPADAECP